MPRETINQRRAVSILMLLGSILYLVVTWNCSGVEADRWNRPVE